ncbi:cation:proton antiporter [Aliiroseovarius subalbicans]|uniref:cation:proton antiporter n=1 Tax=Aliiroseovarius subalbicans TaxID=2925840 RepID=UPI001F59B0CE|nr:cation:proton antiporter [Aliiroseovarius subalbicans]MCI2400679.1 cation:proton antiporter [Aliiroseovarius subalbicans]
MDLALTFTALGALFLVGLAADLLGRRTRLPRVTLLLGLGILAGKSGFDVIPAETEALFEFLSVAALSMVAFLLGGGLTAKKLRKMGAEILWISIVIVIVTIALVAIGLIVIGVPPALALVLGALACATDPAATQDAIRQAGVAKRFGTKLKGIVAVDDAWGLVAFSLIIVLAKGMNGSVDFTILRHAVWDIGGALVLGLAVGLPGAYLTGRLSPGEPQQAEALGIVFLTAGLSLWLNVSYLIAAMVAGLVITNRARHHKRAFHEIELIQWPFMILFFILAGAALELDKLVQIGLVGTGYVILRIVARMVGGWLGARIGDSPTHERPWFGPALLPQAGVAVGMALVASAEFPQHADMILTLTIGATVLFEIVGPAATMFAVRRVDASSPGNDGHL